MQDDAVVLQRGAPKLLSNNASRGPIPDGAAEGPTDAEGMLVGEVDGEEDIDGEDVGNADDVGRIEDEGADEGGPDKVGKDETEGAVDGAHPS